MADSQTQNPAQKAIHPKYSEMIATAIETLKEKGGSSRVAIIKFITSKYKVSDNPNVVNSRLKLALVKGVASGTLTQVKGTGASGSFKKAAEKPKKAAKSPKKAKAKTVAVKSPKKYAKSPKKAAKSPKKPKATKPKPKMAATEKTAAKPKAKKPAVKKPTKK